MQSVALKPCSTQNLINASMTTDGFTFSFFCKITGNIKRLTGPLHRTHVSGLQRYLGHLPSILLKKTRVLTLRRAAPWISKLMGRINMGLRHFPVLLFVRRCVFLQGYQRKLQESCQCVSEVIFVNLSPSASCSSAPINTSFEIRFHSELHQF